MGQRQKARELVLKCLYAYETADQDVDEVVVTLLDQTDIAQESAQFAKTLFIKITENIETLDQYISKYSKNWELSRLAIVDKNILRLGICELTLFPDIPAKVSINQGVELAKRYSTLESSRFVNGILDALYKDNLKEGE